VGLDQERICKRLDACLLSPAEMEAYAQAAAAKPDAVTLDFSQDPPVPVDVRS